MPTLRERAGAGGVILVLLLSQCLWPLLTPPQVQQERWIAEQQAVHAAFGQMLGDVAVRVGLSAGAGFRSFAQEPVLPAAAFRWPSDDTLASGGGVDGVMQGLQRYLLSLGLQLQIFVLRLMGVALWGGILLPILLAGAVDGMVQRRVMLAGLGFQNPTAFALTRAAFRMVGLLPVLYAALPFDMPMVLVPLVVMMLLLPMCLALRNLPPVFTR